MDKKRLAQFASAAAKTILFGEHAVVYGQPGIAIPLPSLRAFAALIDGSEDDGFRIVSKSIGLNAPPDALPETHPQRKLLELLSQRFGKSLPRNGRLEIESSIPVAAGLGSGAAVSVAIIRAFAQRFELSPDEEEVSELAFEIEKIYHGAPSGIDNTVIAYEQPIFYTRGQPARPIRSNWQLPILIADTGIQASTIDIVASVRHAYPGNKPIIDAIGSISRRAAAAIHENRIDEIGALMNENQRLLQELNVSCGPLNQFLAIARRAGALGAKLTGAGRGGNFVVLARNDAEKKTIAEKLTRAGAIVRL